MIKRLLLKFAYWIINRYDKKRVVAKDLGMVIEDPVQFISPSKIEQVEKFLKDL